MPFEFLKYCSLFSRMSFTEQSLTDFYSRLSFFSFSFVLQSKKNVLTAQMNAECLVILTGVGCHSSLQPVRLRMQIIAQISLYPQLKLTLRLRHTKL
uniref:Uncharacterized protein n=2 Tax=Accipitrinae TaxID=8955 RepID=A0A8C0HM55_9AVES